MARSAPVKTENSGIFAARHRYARISARKARLVMDSIRGEPVESALTKLQFSQRRAAPMIRKVVQSAMANAAQKSGLEADRLFVDQAFADEGPTLKRWRPRSMGRAFSRLKRTSHLTIRLSQMEIPDAPVGGESGGDVSRAGEAGKK